MIKGKACPAALQELSSKLPATVSFMDSKEGGYWVRSEDLPGCFAQGDSLHEASRNFKLAVFDYFDIPKRYHNENLLFYVASNLFEEKEVKHCREPVSLIPRQAVPAL